MLEIGVNIFKIVELFRNVVCRLKFDVILEKELEIVMRWICVVKFIIKCGKNF